MLALSRAKSHIRCRSSLRGLSITARWTDEVSRAGGDNSPSYRIIKGPAQVRRIPSITRQQLSYVEQAQQWQEQPAASLDVRSKAEEFAQWELECGTTPWEAAKSLTLVQASNSTVPEIPGERSASSSSIPRPVRQAASTPSTILTEALRDAGFSHSLPYQAIGKPDLSFRAPNRSRTSEGRAVKRNPSLERPSLQFILAQYIRATARHDNDEIQSDGDLIQVFRPGMMQYLHSRHFDVEDVTSWAWILTSSTSEAAATRLLALANSTSNPREHIRNKAPVFLLMYILRREDITTQALRLLLIHAWNMINNVHHPRWDVDFGRAGMPLQQKSPWAAKHRNTGNYTDIDEGTLAKLAVRLFRHARKVWPDAVPSIAMMISTHHQDIVRGVQLESTKAASLSFMYNRMLSLTGLPTSSSPLLEVPVHQRAQVNLLRKMNEFRPPLVVTREGYRAIARVQLAHRKTSQEREWAVLKAKSWPPWKEDRSGLDADKGVEMGITRTTQSLSRESEAGYSPGSWEQAANILAGWDTDSSPTIQTRTIFPIHAKPDRYQLSPNMDHEPLQDQMTLDRLSEQRSSTTKRQNDDLVWAARIQATRTLDEAWACFLAYRDGHLRWSSTVCFPMFQKLVFARINRAGPLDTRWQADQSEDAEAPLVPGDSTHVWATSENPRHRVFLKATPPSEHKFFEDMLEHSIRPGGRFLAFLVKHAQTLGVGLQYLQASQLDPRVIEMFLGKRLIDGKLIRQHCNKYILSAYIRLLCRFGKSVPLRRRALIRTSTHKPFEIMQDGPKSALLHAYRLLVVSQPYYRPPWYDLLAALAASKSRFSEHDRFHPEHNSEADDISSWDAMIHALRQMEAINLPLDFTGFHIFCVGLEQATFAAHTILARGHRKLRVSWRRQQAVNNIDQGSHRVYAHRVLAAGANELKALFLRISTSTAPGDLAQDVDAAFAEYSKISYVDRGMQAKRRPAASMLPDDILPRLLQVPSPAQLHAFVRVLGFAKDRAGVVDLLHWMAYFAPEIEARSCEMRNGRRMMRRVVTCARVMLERWWEGKRASDEEGRKQDQSGGEYDASQELDQLSVGAAPDLKQSERLPNLVQQARDCVERVETWGSWPDDEECEAYCRIGRFI